MSTKSYSSFVHLRSHSAYSLAEGAIKIADLVKLCVNYRMPALALTDTRNLFGSLEFSNKCIENGVQPIIGCQLSLDRQKNNNLKFSENSEPDQIVILCKDDIGYSNLTQIVTRSYIESPPGNIPQVSLEDIYSNSEGLIVLTGGYKGIINRLIMENNFSQADFVLNEMKNVFGDRLYIELQRHRDFIVSDAEYQLLNLASNNSIQIVATNEPFFTKPEMYHAHDALLCIANKDLVSTKNRRRVSKDHWFKPSDEMEKLFSDIPQAIENTLIIATRCSVMAVSRTPILPTLPIETELTEEEQLRLSAEKGLNSRLEKYFDYLELDSQDRTVQLKHYSDRLEYELDIIIEMGFSGYFLIVADFIQWAKLEGIPVGPGRGSGAGSLVAWALLITDLDPIKYGLLFERFLNPARVSMPDFDVDFCQERRDEVIKYVQDKYGNDRVAQIITFGKLQARAALRHVGRVLEIPLGYVDKICKMIPNNPSNPIDLKAAIKNDKELQYLRNTDENISQLFEISIKLEGLYTHASTHASALVIADRPLVELLALYRDPESYMPLTQFDMKWSEQAGLVKFDFLGLKTLTVIDKTVKLLKERSIIIDITNISLEDKKTFSMLSRGDTGGVFQLESSGMRDSLRKLKPDVFEDIIAMVALFRPGPMDNIPSFIERKHGREEISYMHATLEPFLKETYGIMIYQEQVMQAARELADYSLADADLLRRAMGKKLKEEMDAQEQKFISGAMKKGIDKFQSREIFKKIAEFAGYGFNKSHAAAYALLAYQTAFLKANYPVEFFAATMTLDLHDTDKLSSFRSELANLDIELLRPDINYSEVSFSVEDSGNGSLAVRYALAAIRNVGKSAMREIVKERKRGGLYKNIQNLSERLNPSLFNKRLIENLSRAGAFDSLGSNRSAFINNAEKILSYAQSFNMDKMNGQGNIFNNDSEINSILNLPGGENWSLMKTLAEELDSVGFYLSAHPLDPYDSIFSSLGVINSQDIRHDKYDKTKPFVSIAGTVMKRVERLNRNNRKYAIVTFSDAKGVYDAFIYEEVLSKSRHLLEAGNHVICTLNIGGDEGQQRLSVSKVVQLEEAFSLLLDNLKIKIDENVDMLDLQRILREDGEGNHQVCMLAELQEHTVEVILPGSYALSPYTLSKVGRVQGVSYIGK